MTTPPHQVNPFWKWKDQLRWLVETKHSRGAEKRGPVADSIYPALLNIGSHRFLRGRVPSAAQHSQAAGLQSTSAITSPRGEKRDTGGSRGKRERDTEKD